MAVVTYPVGLLTDDAGLLLTNAANVSIASVLNPSTGAAIGTPGATVNTSCLPFVSINYDAVAHGEAVITLSISQTGRIITNANAAPAIYCAVDSSLIDVGLAGLNAPGTSGGLPLANANNSVRVTYGIVKNQAFNNFTFTMLDSTTHLPKPGLGAGVTGTARLDAGAFAPLTNAVQEVASGVYTINLAAADLNANMVTLLFTATGADASIIHLPMQS